MSPCATTAKYEAVLNTWVGHHVDELVSSWGPPVAAFPLSQGGAVIQYSNARAVTLPGQTYQVPTTTDQQGNVNLYGPIAAAPAP